MVRNPVATNPKNLAIRVLNNQADWLAFWALRLTALKEYPEAFASSYTEESKMSFEHFKEGYKNADIFGAFIENSLVGCAGFFVQPTEKMRHKGVLFSMYTAIEHRNKGIADLLLKAVIKHAKKSVLQLQATVVVSNHSALNLYKKNGFLIYGTESRALKISNHFYDEHLMVLML